MYNSGFKGKKKSYHQAKQFIRESDLAFRCCTQPRAFTLNALEQIAPENYGGQTL